jgi:antitoxin YefM
MHKIHLTQDIQPLSEFRAKVGVFIEQVKKTNRPLVITQHGRSTAVLLAVDAYESLIDHLELLRDIKAAQDDVKNGRVLSHSAVKKRLLKKFK